MCLITPSSPPVVKCIRQPFLPSSRASPLNAPTSSVMLWKWHKMENEPIIHSHRFPLGNARQFSIRRNRSIHKQQMSATAFIPTQRRRFAKMVYYPIGRVIWMQAPCRSNDRRCLPVKLWLFFCSLCIHGIRGYALHVCRVVLSVHAAVHPPRQLERTL